jgi:2-haloacid dehalogenase
MARLEVIATDVDALVFDAYGTLFDVHAAVAAHDAAIGEHAAAFSQTWRAKQLEYSWIHSLAGRFSPFWTLTERALDYAMERYGIDDDALRTNLLAAYRHIPPFADVVACLTRLRVLGVKLAILTNANRDMVDTAVSQAGLAPLLGDVISAEDVARFKTDPAVYQLACDRLHMPPSRVAFVSSNAWDVAGAGAFGLACIWLRRHALPREYQDFPMKAVIGGLDDLR